jgi:hypothetical protein
MKRKALFVIVVALFLVVGFAEATCTPAIGYVMYCQAQCIGSSQGGLCEENEDLAHEAYCLEVSQCCHGGSYDDCCVGRHIY